MFAACRPVSGKPGRRSLLWSGRWADCGECIILQEIEPPLSPSDSEDSLNRFLLYGETRLLSTACPSAASSVNVRALLQHAAATWIPVWWRPFWNGQLVTTCWPASHCLRKKVWCQLAHTTCQHKNKPNVYFSNCRILWLKIKDQEGAAIMYKFSTDPNVMTGLCSFYRMLLQPGLE